MKKLTDNECMVAWCMLCFLILYLILLFGCEPASPPDKAPIPIDTQATTELEASFKDDGTLIFAVTQDRILLTWAEMLIRQTSGRTHLPFDSTLYAKYYWRIAVYRNGVRDTVAATMNFRDHLASDPNLYKVLDVAKGALILADVSTDIQASAIWDSLKADELESVSENFRWSWGTKEIKKFNILRFTDVPIAKLDSIAADSVEWKIPPVMVLLDTLGYLDQTLQQLNNDVAIPAQLKSWFLNQITKAGYTWADFQNVLLSDLILIPPVMVKYNVPINSYLTATLLQINNNVAVPAEIKQWVQDEMVRLGLVWDDIKLWTLREALLVFKPESALSRIWLRHPSIAAKLHHGLWKRVEALP